MIFFIKIVYFEGGSDLEGKITNSVLDLVSLKSL